MDMYKGLAALVVTIFLSLTRLTECQRITCRTPCDVGQTCAMVRHGSGPPTPGCISMEEAIMLSQAMNGGPSGPGTGISRTQPVMQQMLQPRGEIIPGMNMLGLGTGSPQNAGFQSRFEQGINGMPATMFNPNEQMFGPVQGQGQQGMFNPGMGPMLGNPPLVGHQNSPFIDPTMRGSPSMLGTTSSEQADGMHFHSTPTNTHTHAQFPGSGIREGVRGAQLSGGGSGIGFPGEILAPPTGPGMTGTSSRSNQITNFNAREAELRARFNISDPNQTPRQERQGEVSPLQEDADGIYFLFYPRVGTPGIRVNFTKEGFCRRDAVTRERNVCTMMCYSDNQCPAELKCCPSGCSLGCLQPQGSTTSGGLVGGQPPASDGECSADIPHWCPVGYQCRQVAVGNTVEQTCIDMWRPDWNQPFPIDRGRQTQGTLETVGSNSNWDTNLQTRSGTLRVNTNLMNSASGVNSANQNIARAPTTGLANVWSMFGNSVSSPIALPFSRDNLFGTNNRNIGQSVDSSRIVSRVSAGSLMTNMATDRRSDCRPCERHTDCRDMFMYCVTQPSCPTKVCRSALL